MTALESPNYELHRVVRGPAPLGYAYFGPAGFVKAVAGAVALVPYPERSLVHSRTLIDSAGVARSGRLASADLYSKSVVLVPDSLATGPVGELHDDLLPRLAEGCLEEHYRSEPSAREFDLGPPTSC